MRKHVLGTHDSRTRLAFMALLAPFNGHARALFNREDGFWEMAQRMRDVPNSK